MDLGDPAPAPFPEGIFWLLREGELGSTGSVSNPFYQGCVIYQERPLDVAPYLVALTGEFSIRIISQVPFSVKLFFRKKFRMAVRP